MANLLDIFNRGLDVTGDAIDSVTGNLPSRVINGLLDTVGPIAASGRNTIARTEENINPNVASLLSALTGIQPGERSTYSRNQAVDNARKILSGDPEAALNFAGGVVNTATALPVVGGLGKGAVAIGGQAIPKLAAVAPLLYSAVKNPYVGLPLAGGAINAIKSRISKPASSPETTSTDTESPQSPKAMLSEAIRQQIQQSIGDATSNGVITGKGIEGKPDQIGVDFNADKSKGFSRSLAPIADYQGKGVSLRDPSMFAAYTKALGDLGKRADALMSSFDPEDIKKRFGTDKVTLEQKRSYARELALQDLPPEFQQIILSQQGADRPGPQAIQQARIDLEKQAKAAKGKTKEDSRVGLGTLAGGAALLAGAIYLARARAAQTLMKQAAQSGGSQVAEAISRAAAPAATAVPELLGLPAPAEAVTKAALQTPEVIAANAPKALLGLPAPGETSISNYNFIPKVISMGGEVGVAAPSAEEALRQAINRAVTMQGQGNAQAMMKLKRILNEAAAARSGPKFSGVFRNGGLETLFDSTQTPLTKYGR